MIVRLGDYIQEYSVRNRDDEEIPVYSVTNKQGFCKDYFGKEVASKDKTTYKIVPRGCFAYNPSRINVGSVDWQRNEKKVIVSPLYNVFSVSSEVNRQFLYYYLKSDKTVHYIKNIARGSVRDNLKLDMLYEFKIDLPDKKEQERAATILDKVCELIGQHNQQLYMLDELVKSRFVEMFGDTKINNKRWKTTKLLNILEKGSSVSYGIVQTGDDIEGGVPVFRPIDIAGGHIPKISELKRTDKEISDKYKRTLLKGYELLITVRGSVGETFQTNVEFAGCNVGRNIVPLRFDTDKVLYKYMENHFSQSGTKDILASMTKGIALQGLNMSEFREIAIIIPPIELQKEFVRFAETIDKSKSAIQKSLDELEILKKSLMQKYFG